jgi:hypothetical protein
MSPGEAHRLILRCLDEEAYELNPHFVKRLTERGPFLSEALAACESPDHVKLDGPDGYSRFRVLLTGTTQLGTVTLLICIERDPPAEFITIYWE